MDSYSVRFIMVSSVMILHQGGHNVHTPQMMIAADVSIATYPSQSPIKLFVFASPVQTLCLKPTCLKPEKPPINLDALN